MGKMRKLAATILCGMLFLTEPGIVYALPDAQVYSEAVQKTEDGREILAENGISDIENAQGPVLEEFSDSETDDADEGYEENILGGDIDDITEVEDSVPDVSLEDDSIKEEETYSVDVEYGNDETGAEENAVPAQSTDIASGTVNINGEITWIIDANGRLTVTGTGDVAENLSWNTIPWKQYTAQITSAKLSVTGMTDANSLFWECYNMKSVDLSEFDASKVTSTGNMFYSCSKLENVDLSGLDLSNVTSMGGMFSGCHDLKSVNMSGMDLSRSVNILSMFDGCSSLESVSLKDASMYARGTMACMFRGCKSLTSLDLRGLDTSDVTDMSSMFYGCEQLTSVDLSGFDTSSVMNMACMFLDCKSLPNLSLKNFDMTNVEYISSMFSGCTNLKSVDFSGVKVPDIKNISYMFEDCSSLTSIDLRGFSVVLTDATGASTSQMFEGCTALTSIWTPCYASAGEVTFPNVSLPGNIAWYRQDGTSVTELPWESYSVLIYKGSVPPKEVSGTVHEDYGEIQWSIDTAGKLTVTGKGNIHSETEVFMPWYPYSDWIKSAKLSVTGMTDASHMFDSCENLTNIDMSELDTYSIENMYAMFYNCSSLTSLDLSGFDTRNVRSMGQMFSDCTNLSSLDVSSFNTGKVDDMSGMFSGCSNLRSLDVSSFDTGNVTNMNDIFSDCSSLSELDVSHFDTANVTSMSSAFYNCSKLLTLDVSGFDTDHVVYIDNMFVGCNGLSSLDLSSFNLGSLEEQTTLLLLPDEQSLRSIKTPTLLKATCALPQVSAGAVWYRENDTSTSIKELPRGETCSIEIARDQAPQVTYPYITVKKTRTFYLRGEELGIDDLTVTCHTGTWKAENVTAYTTNADTIDMFTPGIKELTVIYNEMPASVFLTVTGGYDGSGIAGGTVSEDYGQIQWTIDSKGKLTVEGTGDLSQSSGPARIPWYAYNKKITSAEIRVTGMTDASYLFYDCYNLSSIDVSGLKTSQIKNMSSMFEGCENLEALDVSAFSTGLVTDMSDMFSCCKKLTVLDVSGFDTRQVTDMSGMFNECIKLIALDVSGFDTSHVTDMNAMFDICMELTVLDVSGFDTSRVKNMSNMFTRCMRLTELYLSNFNTSRVISMRNMFYGCENLTELNLGSFDMNRVTDAEMMIANCTGLKRIWTPVNLKESVVPGENWTEEGTSVSGVWYREVGSEVTELPKNLNYSILLQRDTVPHPYPYIIAHKAKFHYECGEELNIDDLTVTYRTSDGTGEKVTNYTTNAEKIDMNTPGSKDLTVTYENQTTVVKLMVAGKYKEPAIAEGTVDEEYGKLVWYIDINGKLTVEGTGDYLPGAEDGNPPWYPYHEQILSAEIIVSDMTNASSMFLNCENLSSVELSRFDTSKVTNMSRMFCVCKSLAALDLSGFDTGRVINMYSMFSECSSLKELDLDSFDTSSVIQMAAMFDGCTSLNELDLSSFNTSAATNMSYMFRRCTNLIDLDISSFDTSVVTGMQYMFSDCQSLTKLDLSHFDTSQVEYMEFMFYSCNSLTELNISNFNTSKVVWMGRMFAECKSLPALDVSSFDISQVQFLGRMFDGCSSLTELDLSNFGASKAEDPCYMFYGCTSLTKLNLSHFNTSYATDMQLMFYGCKSLAELNLSSFDTSHVTNMTHMFYGCEALSMLDVSSFDTSQVINMRDMFYDCHSLEELDLSHFNTSQVTDMTEMFYFCRKLKKLDVSNFNTSHVESITGIFACCDALSELDMSNFDLSQAAEAEYLVFVESDGSSQLTSIKTPVNLTGEVALPGGTWYREGGGTITQLPQNLNYSTLLQKNEVPADRYPYITAKKSKIRYICEDELNTDDLTVVYYGKMGEGETVTDYITNADELDMFTPGRKELVITRDGLTTTIKLTVVGKAAEIPSEVTHTVTFDLQGHGSESAEYAVHAVVKGNKIVRPVAPEDEKYSFTGWYKDAECKIRWDFEIDTVESDIILYAGWEETKEDPIEITFTVTFDLQGHGSESAEYMAHTVVKGNKITSPVAPNARGYIFTGWYKEAECKVKWDFEIDTVESDTILYAGWETDPKLGDVIPEDAPENGIIPEGLWAVTEEKEYEYTGSAIKPIVHVYWGTKRLDEDVDYTVSYKNNVKASSTLPVVIVKGKSVYKSKTSCEARFVINPVSLENVTIEDITVVETKKQQKKIPVVTYNGKKLSAKKDFTVDHYEEGDDAYKVAGVYGIRLVGTGNFEGERLVNMEIIDPSSVTLIRKASVKKIPKQDYTGEEIELDSDELVVKMKGRELSETVDYTVSYENNVEIGTATVIIKGINDYAGTKKVTFKITGKSLKKASITGLTMKKSMVYNGEEQVQDTENMELHLKDDLLIENEDYTVTYSKNKNVGKAMLILTGIHGYTGVIKKSFKITAYDIKLDPDKQIKGLEPDTVYEAVYIRGRKSKPDLQLTFKGEPLVENKDYSVSCKNNTDVTWEGTKKKPTATIKGKGNFKGKVTREFIIKF